MKFQKRSVYFWVDEGVKGPIGFASASPALANMQQKHEQILSRGTSSATTRFLAVHPTESKYSPSPVLLCSFRLETARCVALCSNRQSRFSDIWACADLSVGHKGVARGIISRSPKQNSKQRLKSCSNEED